MSYLKDKKEDSLLIISKQGYLMNILDKSYVPHTLSNTQPCDFGAMSQNENESSFLYLFCVIFLLDIFSNYQKIF